MAALSGVERGGAVLCLRSAAGEVARVHLCKRDERVRGIAHSRHVELFLMNGTSGDSDTPETLGRVILTLARQIEANEATCGALPPMMTHAERLQRFGSQELV